jgi:hypothetical protein
MGYYIQTTQPKNKADAIMKDLAGIEITVDEAAFFIKEQMGAIICVVDNGPFEAAAYCYNLNEFRVFTDPNDDRPKKWLLVENEERVKELTRFTKAG